MGRTVLVLGPQRNGAGEKKHQGKETEQKKAEEVTDNRADGTNLQRTPAFWGTPRTARGVGSRMLRCPAAFFHSSTPPVDSLQWPRPDGAAVCSDVNNTLTKLTPAPLNRHIPATSVKQTVPDKDEGGPVSNVYRPGFRLHHWLKEQLCSCRRCITGRHNHDKNCWC